MDKIIDLHTHSCFSDGTLTPKELIREAKNAGLSAVALTDHDTLDGLKEALAAGIEFSIEVISGIEFSITSEYGALHILGLFVDPEVKEFKETVALLRQKRQDRNASILEKLSALGVHLNPEDLRADCDGLITRAHFAKAMVTKGYCTDMNDAYSRYLRFGAPAFVPKKTLLPEECIRLIHKAGGVAVLAHLNQLNFSDNSELIKIVSTLKDMGLDAIEGYYHDYSPEFVTLCAEIADIFDLCLSGGSDFHGQNKKNVIGQVSSGTIPYILLEKLKKRAGQKDSDCGHSLASLGGNRRGFS